MAEAIRESGILKKASCHTFRHSFATRSLDNGAHQRGIQSPADSKLAALTNWANLSLNYPNDQARHSVC